ncbi:MAG: TlpA family protein disulfide reductase [Verrucomicrobia bacterium]|nr:MAG: TlpA family protein disulfide reductase [Verrucomicrobiota bacterium]
MFFALLSACTLVAAPLKFDTLKVGSKTYYKVTTIGANATDLYFTHTKGISNVKLRLLPPEVQKHFEYDPNESAETERAQANDDKAYYDMLQGELTAKAQKKIRKAKEESQSSENNIVDPISDRSYVGKTAPKLEVEKWMGEKPFTAGKNVLVFFWTTWSKPCQAEIPILNALQKKFSDRLVIVGISGQSEEDVREYAGPAMEFPNAVESEGKLANVIGATSVPYAMLVGTNGVVIYQGHPDALSEARLVKVLSPPPGQ